MTKKKFVFDISWSLISQVVVITTSFLLSILLGRFLGPSSLGLYTIILTIYSITALIGSFGVSSAIIKFVAEFKDDDENKLKSFISCALINSVILGAISSIVLFFTSTLIATAFDMPELNILIKILSISMIFVILNNTLLGIFNGLRKMKIYSLRAVIRSGLLIFLTILFIYMGLGVNGAVFGLLLSEIGTFIIMVFMSKKYFIFVISDYMKNTTELLKLGSQLFLASSIYMINTYVDTILVGYFLNDTAVGIYAIALSLSKGFLIIPGAISNVSFPTVSEYNRKSIPVGNLINKLIKYTLVILSILGIIIVFFSNEIILLLLSPEFLPAIIPMTILIFSMILFGSMSSVGTAFSAIGRADIPFKINIIALVLNLTLNIILIPVLGINGAAISTATSFIVLTLLAFYLFKSIMNIKIEILSHLTVLLSVFLIIALFFIFKDLINIYIFICILTAYSAIVIHFLIDYEDKQELKNLIKNIIKRFK